MNEGDIALASLPQADGGAKLRPVLLLRAMPPFGDWLVCGISTQLRQEVPGFDELLDAAQADFATSGLKAPSLIRLGFLNVLPAQRFVGVLGAVASIRHQRLLQKLCRHLLVPKNSANKN
jgi:mRNA interferase MazF